MKLVMITRKVDRGDALAGFTYGWVRELARQLDHLWVITWQQSNGDGLPVNVTLLSLSGTKVAKCWQLWRSMAPIMKRVDGIFCHMNPEYTILAAPIAQWYKRRIVSWYTHKAVTWRRRLLELFADRIVTASPESFRAPWFPKKVSVIGHGIDTEHFRPSGHEGFDSTFRIITVGRVAPTKHVEAIIEAVALLNDRAIHLDIIGDAVFSDDGIYKENLERHVRDSGLAGQVRFLGWVPHLETAAYYQSANLFINLSDTGSLDKAVLEAMACGCPVVTSNEAFQALLPEESFISSPDTGAVVSVVRRYAAYGKEELSRRGFELRSMVESQHSLSQCIRRIISQFLQ